MWLLRKINLDYSVGCIDIVSKIRYNIFIKIRRGVYMERYQIYDVPKPARIARLIEAMYAKMPEVEASRAVLITESYRETEGQPIMDRRSKAFVHILDNIPCLLYTSRCV